MRRLIRSTKLILRYSETLFVGLFKSRSSSSLEVRLKWYSERTGRTMSCPIPKRVAPTKQVKRAVTNVR